jgi:hypothetical protein
MITKKTLLLAFAAMVFALGIASPAHASTCTPLALSMTPTNPEELQPVSIVNSITNCSQSAAVITVNVNLLPNLVCWKHSESFSFKVLLRAGKTRTFSFMLPAPPCDGAYRVSETSSNGGSATATLIVN